ncbi:MAG: hypothetical protein U9N83_13710 [Thermodesulfobacteriota bacterium]|nr:hypothetical protein [Thermodesulfobacteriota bacterium]
MKHPEKITVFKRESVPKGRSLKINLKMTDYTLEIFKEIKQRQACKTNSDVFNYIYKFASKADLKKSIKKTQEPGPKQSKQRRTFTINEYILARLRKLAKKHQISPDELVEITLSSMEEVRQAAEFILKHLEGAVKYANKDYCLKVIENIWEKVTELRYGLDLVFNLEYDGLDPENYNTWLGDIEGGLQELEDLVPKLFEQKKAAKKS